MSEGFGMLCRWAAEYQHRSVGGIRQSSGHHQFAAVVGFLDEREVLDSKRAAPLYVIVGGVIEQEEVHDIVKDSVFREGP